MNAPRKLATRLVSATLLAWLSVFAIEPLGVHSCPMHGGLSVEGGHSAHAMVHQHHGTPARGDHTNQCSCIGECAGPATGVALIPNAVNVPAAISRFRAGVLIELPSFAARYTSRLQPFPNGPPELS